MPKEPKKIYGLADVARAQKISVELARQWHFRGKFPPPDYVMGRRPGWKRETLEKAGILEPEK
jgi:hypothetical protein